MNVWPLTVIVPVRVEVFGLADALKLTVPFPVPPGEPITVSQPALLDAVHVQDDGVVTLNDPVPPPNGTEPLVAESA